MERVFIVSGEKSGDLIAKDLIVKLKQKYPDIQIRGIGGESFASNGLKSLFDQKSLAVMGFFEIIPKIPQMLKWLKLARREVYNFKPECIITIDSPGFNFRLVRSVQNTRLSQKELYKTFNIFAPEKSAKATLQNFRRVKNVIHFIQNNIANLLNRYKFLRFFNEIIGFFNNKYTQFAVRFVLKPVSIVIKHTPFKLIILAILGKFIAVASILYAVVLYFNIFRFVKWPIIIGHKFYAKILHRREAKQDLSRFYRSIEIRKLQSKNTMLRNFLYVIQSFESSLPKFLKFKFLTATVKRLTNFYKMFKKMEYQKAFSCKMHHIVAPSVWAYKENRAQKVATLYDTLFCILPFEPPYFEKYGLKTAFVGYQPYFRMMDILPTIYKTHKEKMVISITLGSRLGEVKKHIPIIQHTIRQLEKSFPDSVEFNIISLPNFKPLLLKYFFKYNILTEENAKWQAVYNSDFMIAKSGTNVMECAFLGIPSIVYYKTGIITGFLIKRWAYIKYITLVNITANKEILPEFTQSNVWNIHKKAQEWLENEQHLNAIKEELKAELQKFTSKSNPSEIIISVVEPSIMLLKPECNMTFNGVLNFIVSYVDNIRTTKL